jgi:maltose alpha-D-glucosyltransferase/alpha-amylase
MKAYEDVASSSPSWIADAGDRNRLLRFNLLTRALYEILYEAKNRPDWIATPIRGVIEILDARQA